MSMPEIFLDRRGRGRIVDLRIRLNRTPDAALRKEIENALRENDAVLPSLGEEVEVALAGTSVEDAERVVVPRVRATLEAHGLVCTFWLNGKPVL